jgi:hypothetical protein
MLCKLLVSGELRRFELRTCTWNELVQHVSVYTAPEALNAQFLEWQQNDDLWSRVEPSDAALEQIRDMLRERAIPTLRLRYGSVVSSKQGYNAASAKAARAAAKSACKYVARFVRHVSYNDDSELEPGERFTKTWRFRNEGTTRWPSEYKLLFVSKQHGDIMGANESVVQQHTPESGEEVNVSVDLIAPMAAGRYSGFWRLAQPDGRKFGPRVRVQIVVHALDSIELQELSLLPENSSDKTVYSCMRDLELMGFQNAALNRKVLQRVEGNLHEAVKILVRITVKQALAQVKQ